MAQTFNLLRANDLIWSFYVNNYLLGRDPKAFDLLFWNGDSTRMPCKMHSFYLRKMYLENKLCEKNGISILGTKIDLGSIHIPTYFLSTREDHIAPWLATYANTYHIGGDKTFVLAGSGHIAGVINPPSAHKYNYWLNDHLVQDPEEWLAHARSVDGSWWNHWRNWVGQQSKMQIPAITPTDKGLGNAPGSYVLMK